MDPSTSAAAAQAARDEDLRGVCAKAFTHYENGYPRRGEKLLVKFLARHPARPLLHYARVRLAHKAALGLRQPVDAMTQFEVCKTLVLEAQQACRDLLLARLMCAQVLCDEPPHHLLYDGPFSVNAVLGVMRDLGTLAAAISAISPLNTAVFEHAKAIATFDEEVFTLALLPDVRECADSAAYRREALACLAKAPAMFIQIHREAEDLAGNTPGNTRMAQHIDRRDTEHAAEAARRLQRVQVRASEEEAAWALAAVHRVMAGESTAHDLREAAAGWRESADQGDASAQLLIGAMYARGGGGVKKCLPLGKRYLELSAASGNEAAVALLKELRKCVACGKLDVHHMICSRCRNVRFCDATCQLWHWESATDPHKLHCVKRRAAVEAGGSSSERADPSADNN
jgi:hypothetical protein